jgi:hypothetical protein
MDFSDLYGELNRRLHGDTSNTTFLAELKGWINLARKQIVAFNPDWYFLHTTATVALVNAQSQYTLASDLVKINPEEVRLTTTKTRLEHIETKDFEFVLATPTTAATPTHFRLAGFQTIQLYPPPNSAAVTAETSFTYEYTKTFNTDMTGDSDTHDLPVHFEPVLLDVAEALGWMYLRNSAPANFAWQRALTSMQAHAPGNEFLKRLSLNVAPPMMTDKAEQPISGEGMT